MPKVLFLDTQPYIYNVLKRKFELEGFEVIAADNSLEKPDLIVMGRQETSLTLAQLTQEVSQVPIIMLSDDAPMAEGLAQSLLVSHLKMPFRPSQLMKMARKVVSVAL